MYISLSFEDTIDKMGIGPCFGYHIDDDDDQETTTVSPTHSGDSTTQPEVESESIKVDNDDESEAPIVEIKKFSYQDIASATNNFRSFITKIGNPAQDVVVKKLNQTVGNDGFRNEIKMLSQLHHPNLINLIGYCDERDQRFLVYEYMPLRTLHYYLHGLDWNTRMKIAAGIANGLDYLHNTAKPPVILRNMRSANILLDNNYCPKLSNFGLAMDGPTDEETHITISVLRTVGYIDPEYFLTGKLTSKSDIYNFGIVLLELITGHRAIEKTLIGTRRLTDWVYTMLSEEPKSLIELADQNLEGEFEEEMVKRAVDIAQRCIEADSSARPNTSELVSDLNSLVSQPYDPSKGVIRGKGKEILKDLMESDEDTSEETSTLKKKL